MIVDSIEGLDETSQFVRLRKAFPKHDVYLKLEGLNTAGSVKLKTAISLVDSLEKQGTLKKGGWLVESSSGSLGVALAAVAARRGYRLSIVSDLNANPKSIAHMRALGAEVEVVEQRDAAGGFLGTRLARIRELVSSCDGPLWTNQYSNQANPFVHSSKTYRAIVDALGDPDYIFVGAGTTGTLMGVCRGVAASRAATRVYAVDSVGSVTFGGVDISQVWERVCHRRYSMRVWSWNSTPSTRSTRYDSVGGWRNWRVSSLVVRLALSWRASTLSKTSSRKVAELSQSLRTWERDTWTPSTTTTG